MPVQSATSTIARAVTAGAGVFAPGHVGELTQYLPFELVDDVLELAGTRQARPQEGQPVLATITPTEVSTV